MNDETLGAQIVRALRRLVVATVVLYAGLAAAFFYGYTNAAGRDELEQTAASVNRALCAMRADFEAQVASSELFLIDNPEGIPGIPVSLILQGIAQDKKTVRALSGLDCTTGGT